MPVNPIVPKRNSTAGSSTGPIAAALQSGELASNTYLGRLYLKKEDNTVKTIGADASDLTEGTLPAGRLPALSGDIDSAAGSASLSVTGLQGTAVATDTPTSGQVLKFDGTAWAPAAANAHSHAISSVTGLQSALDGKQAAGNYAPLVDGLVPQANLPSYVDDVLEYVGTASFPATGETGKIYVDTNTNISYRWSGSSYVAIVSGGAPTGGAGGDLSGSYPNPTVAKIRGVNVSATAPTSGQVLKYDGTQWTPSNETGGGGGGSGITALTGDVTASGSGSQAATLAASGVTAGTYGSSTAVPVVTFDAKGRATAASTQAITAVGIGAEPAITTLAATKLPALTGDVTSSAGSASTAVGKIQGRTVASTAPTSNQALAWNATSSQWEPTTLTPSAIAPVLTSFTGDGSATLFAISGYTNTNPANYLVVIGGVAQRPHSSVYTVSSSGVQLSAAPANGVSGYVLAYQTPTGASPLGYTALNAAGDTLTGALNEAQGANIASAATVNLTTATGNYVQITGTTTITAITLAQGASRTVVFAGALTLTNGASLILPGAASISTAAGDVAMFRGEAAGVVRCVAYTKANGQAISTSGGGSGSSGGGIKIFDTVGANQSWTVPSGVTSVKITVIGAGGGSANDGGATAGSGGSSTCSIGGSTVTATGGTGASATSGGTGGSVAAVAGVGLGAGSGGAAGSNGSGSSGGYGGGGGSTSWETNGAGGGCGIGGGGAPHGVGRNTGGSGSGYGGTGGSYLRPAPSGWGGGAGCATTSACGSSGYGGGGGGYAVYSVAVTAGQTYSNAITVGAGGAAGGSGTAGSKGAVIIEW